MTLSLGREKDKSSNNRDSSIFEVTSVFLDHTGGCEGKDEAVNKAILKRQGRRYENSVLDLIRSDVVSGRYSTDDVRSKLIEVGCKDVTLAEATNLRCLLFFFFLSRSRWSVRNLK